MNAMARLTYDRDATVAAVRDFYDFLTRIPRWSAGDFEDAPPGGWPELTDEYLSPLGKDAIVCDLLRHLPYLSPKESDESDGDKSMVAPETHVLDYNSRNTRWWFENKRETIDGIYSPIGAGIIPSHVAVITSGSRYGSWLLIDTHDGRATDFIQQERPEKSAPDQDSPDYWRAYRTLPVAAMLEEWKQKYSSLEWVVVPNNYDDGVMYYVNDESTDQVRAIYRQHGWPDSFRRQDCRQALTEWYEAR
ncbi:hypothetical protein SBRCBS47491_000908 [Sporothrix bragantina]|uniref:Knr4/Smi1-like domain-containing protein n=1 Tax=Sporothrix bragantina TaxID=671064 RepID=A0ABP0AU69_9PEZI